VNSKTYIQ